MADTNHALTQCKAAISSGDFERALNLILPLCNEKSNAIASQALHLSGICALELGRLNDAVGFLAGAIEKKSNSAQLYELCWKIHFQAESYTEARRVIELGIERCGLSPTLLSQLASLETRQGNYNDAERLLLGALKLDAQNVLALINLGSLYEIVGRVKESVSCFQKALAIEPENTIAISNLLLTLNYLPLGKKSIAQAHQLHTNPIKPFSVKPFDLRVKHKRIRVAYLSSDFRFHAVAFFLLPLVSHHDKRKFDTYCYADNSSQDEVTELFKAEVTHWRNINTLSDQKVADLLVEDQIDILVDLSGHSLGRRLRLMKSKPVPFQVSYLGYPNTLGLDQIDCRIVDEITDPIDQKAELFYERLYRLKVPFLSYWPIGKLPPITELPAMDRGHITFGSFNRLSKISEDSVRLWSQLLKRVSGSKLLLKTRALDHPETAKRIQERFLREGVPPSQLIIQGGTTNHYQYLEGIAQVDIALDSMPYNGTTTTCNSLIMGVPVLSVMGDRHCSRVSASILKAVSLERFIAKDDMAFLQAASDLITDLEYLRELRRTLRQSVLDSPLADGERLAKNIEKCYLSIIKK